MTDFEPIDEISRVRLTELADKATGAFRDAILPIYGSTPNGTPMHIGTCVALVISGKHYLVTAAHIIDNNEESTLYVGCGELHQLEKEFFATDKPGGDRANDHYDFAIGELTDSELSSFSTAKFLSESEITDTRHEPNGTVFTAIGYPNSKNKRVDNNAKSITPKLFNYSNKSSTQKNPLLDNGYNAEHHIFIGFDKKYSQDTGGNRVSSVNPRGVSGGAFIDIGNLANPMVLAGCENPEPRLAGIIIEFHSEHRLIVATRIQLILQALREQYSDLV